MGGFYSIRRSIHCASNAQFAREPCPGLHPPARIFSQQTAPESRTGVFFKVKVYRVAVLGAGASPAYHLVSAGSSLTPADTVVIGGEQPWRAVRGADGVVNQSLIQISPRYDRKTLEGPNGLALRHNIIGPMQIPDADNPKLMKTIQGLDPLEAKLPARLPAVVGVRVKSKEGDATALEFMGASAPRMADYFGIEYTFVSSGYADVLNQLKTPAPAFSQENRRK
jgi:hypothetical protein